MGRKDRPSKSKRGSRQSKSSLTKVHSEHRKKKSKPFTKHTVPTSSRISCSPTNPTDSRTSYSQTESPSPPSSSPVSGPSRKIEDVGDHKEKVCETTSSEDLKVANFDAVDKVVLATDLDLGSVDGVEYEYDPFGVGDPDVSKDKRTRIVLDSDGEPELVSDYDSDYEDLCPCSCDLAREECHKRIVKVYVTPPVIIPRKEYVFHVNVVGESDVLEVNRIDENHPLPNCKLRCAEQEKREKSLYPLGYVQGVCSEILDPDIPAPRWLGEEFDKTEEELEQEKKERHKLKEMEIEYEF